jgi:hypothetical protein
MSRPAARQDAGFADGEASGGGTRVATSQNAYTVQSHFEARDPQVAKIYAAILRAAKKFGPVREDPKKTSIHLVRETAFAGVATRKSALILTIKSATDIRNKRITKHEQASANRWHLEIRLESPSEVDAELTGWLQESYARSG